MYKARKRLSVNQTKYQTLHIFFFIFHNICILPVLVEPGVVYGEVVHGAGVPCCTGYCTPLAGTWVPHCTPLAGTWVPRGHTADILEIYTKVF